MRFRQPAAALWHVPHLALKLVGLVIGTVAVTLASLFFWLTSMPRDLTALQQRPSPTTPAQSYDETLAAFATVQQGEAALPLNALCRSKLLTHGHRTARVVIYFHGFTSCPAQGDALAERLFAAGNNVLLPRMAGHGAADPAAFTMADVTAGGLIDLANTTIDLAQGLGDNVTVIGLSAGGTIAAWAAQNRADVDQAMAVSPFLGPYLVPSWANRAASNLLLTLPDQTLWWNPLENVAPPRAEYSFARPSTHALAEIMLLGQSVEASASRTPPAATRIDVLLNGADMLVNNHLTTQLVQSWTDHGMTVSVGTLPFSAHLPHDVINPHEYGANIELVYARLTDLVNRASPD